MAVAATTWRDNSDEQEEEEEQKMMDDGAEGEKIGAPLLPALIVILHSHDKASPIPMAIEGAEIQNVAVAR